MVVVTVCCSEDSQWSARSTELVTHEQKAALHRIRLCVSVAVNLGAHNPVTCNMQANRGTYWRESHLPWACTRGICPLAMHCIADCIAWSGGRGKGTRQQAAAAHQRCIRIGVTQVQVRDVACGNGKGTGQQAATAFTILQPCHTNPYHTIPIPIPYHTIPPQTTHTHHLAAPLLITNTQKHALAHARPVHMCASSSKYLEVCRRQAVE